VLCKLHIACYFLPEIFVLISVHCLHFMDAVLACL